MREGDGVQISPAYFHELIRVPPFFVNVPSLLIAETSGINGILREPDEIVNGHDRVIGCQGLQYSTTQGMCYRWTVARLFGLSRGGMLGRPQPSEAVCGIILVDERVRSDCLAG